jgi:hypothetical protein
MGVLNATQHQCDRHRKYRIWEMQPAILHQWLDHVRVYLRGPQIIRNRGRRPGSEGKHSYAGGVEAQLLRLPLTMHERVMIDDRA